MPAETWTDDGTVHIQQDATVEGHTILFQAWVRMITLGKDYYIARDSCCFPPGWLASHVHAPALIGPFMAKDAREVFNSEVQRLRGAHQLEDLQATVKEALEIYRKKSEEQKSQGQGQQGLN